MSTPIALAAYARHLGITPQALQVAINRGRLHRSLVIVRGKRKIRSIEQADKEWAQTEMRAPQNGKRVEQRIDGLPALAESRARYHQSKAKAAELQLLERQGTLVPLDKVRDAVAEKFVLVKTQLLALPIEARQRIPNMTDADVNTLDALIRETLQNLGGEIG